MSKNVVRVCGNMECFYYETIFSQEDLVWKDHWNPLVGDLMPEAHCPSCMEKCDTMELSEFPLYTKVYKDGVIQLNTNLDSKEFENGSKTL